jgi:hypothetical protein
MFYANMSVHSDLQLKGNRITQIFGTPLEKKTAPPTYTFFTYVSIYILPAFIKWRKVGIK